MTEFEVMKQAFERSGDEIVVTIWGNLDEALIENETEGIEFWFKHNKLTTVSNVREY